MGMEDSARRKVDVGEVEIDRGRGIVRAMRERESRAIVGREGDAGFGGRWCGNSGVVKEGEWLVEWSGMG